MNRPAISRVLLADDHVLYRRELRDLLEQRLGIEVVGETGDAGELMRLAEQLEPDAVLVDVTATRMDGIAVTRALVALRRDMPVIALSLYADPQFSERAHAAGASAFVTRGELLDQLPDALQAPAPPAHGIFRSAAHGRTRSTRSSTLLCSSAVAVP